jgi:hypothetical protein
MLFVALFAFLPAGRRVVLHPRQILMAVTPGHGHLPTIKILHLDKNISKLN